MILNHSDRCELLSVHHCMQLERKKITKILKFNKGTMKLIDDINCNFYAEYMEAKNLESGLLRIDLSFYWYLPLAWGTHIVCELRLVAFVFLECKRLFRIWSLLCPRDISTKSHQNRILLLVRHFYSETAPDSFWFFVYIFNAWFLCYWLWQEFPWDWQNKQRQ